MTPRIHQLPPDTVSKIAAGEVVERPASVVKELVENSIDAGATSITVDVVEGGRDLIRVVDDGAGIAAADLPLAVASHATSKLTCADDLFRIGTLGFRGEALSSIAGVSDFRIQSRPADQPIGTRLEVRQGTIQSIQECGCPVGTQIEVRNLFESVPVRRKFLKSKQTELGHVTEAVIRTALAQPGISMTLRHNDRALYELPRNVDREAAVRLFFGPQVADALISVSSEDDGTRLSGFVAHPSESRPTNRMQYLFVNGRCIRDRSLGHAVQEAYRGLLLSGRFPVWFLFLEVPPEVVDVNVHPTKSEVRFAEPRRIYSQILSTIRERFFDVDLSAEFHPPRHRQPERSATPEFGREAFHDGFGLRSSLPTETQPELWSPGDFAPARVASVEEKLVGTSHVGAREPSAPGTLLSPAGPSSSKIEPGTTAVVEQDHTRRGSAVSLPYDALADPAVARSRIPTHIAPDPTGPVERVRAIQLHNSYLVVETQEGMLLVDQHALHERILYEQLKERMASESVEVQELLVPEPVDLTPTQVGLLLEQRSVLAKAGLILEEFGERTVLVQGYPAMLRKVQPTELLRDLACRLEETGRAPSREQLLDDMLHMTACKAAVKAGDPLTPGEIESLVRGRTVVDDSHHCPHGRPTVLRFTLGELERQFQRK